MTMVISKLPYDLSLIAPRVPKPQSDKYSRNLCNWLRRHSGMHGAGVWCTQDTDLGESVPFTYEHAGRSDIFIGFNDGMVTGSRLHAILGGRDKIFAYVKTGDALDITDWFWAEYLKRGRCLTDPHHHGVTHDKDRFVNEADDVRTCQWCGDRQVLTVTERIVKDQRWVSATRKAGT